MKTLALLCLFLLAAPVTNAQSTADNTALTGLYKVDQSARQAKDIDWEKLNVDDAKRRTAVHAMLAAGTVHTAADYFHAAMVFQHGDHPDDYLLAHILAVTSISLGGKPARWLAAATLDRYLRAQQHPQVFGTQFKTEGTVWSHEPIDAALITDSMRAAACVTSAAEQEQMLQRVKAGGEFQSTKSAVCRGEEKTANSSPVPQPPNSSSR